MEREEERRDEIRRKEEERNEGLQPLEDEAGASPRCRPLHQGEASALPQRLELHQGEIKRKREASAPRNAMKRPKLERRPPEADAARLRALSELKFDGAIQEMSQNHAKNMDMAKHFVEVLVAMRQDSTTVKAMVKLFAAARAMSRRFTGSDIRKFTMLILRNGRFSNDRLHAARQLHQFSLGPGIILDSFSKEQVNWISMYRYLSCWRGSNP
jgi:hypothetical protein